MNNLLLSNLTVSINNKKILHNINLSINKGDVVLIMGPNGQGKSTLLKSIFKHYSTKIESGEILIDGKNVNDLTTDEVARHKMYYATQHPVEIPGLSMMDLLRNEVNLDEDNVSIFEMYKSINKKVKELDINPELLNRSINENFSGGERKKVEILQMEILNPDFIFLDEIDSGLDVDGVQIISSSLKKQMSENKTIVFISHNDKLFSEITPNKVVVIVNGKIVKTGDKLLAERINKEGYQWILSELNISIENEDNQDDLLKSSLEGFYCHGK